MDIQNEYEKIKSLLENAECLGNISGGTRKEIQEKFWSLLTLLNQQQETIATYEKTLKELPLQKELFESMEDNAIITVEYEDIINTIIDGLLQHNKAQIIGKLLTLGSISTYDLDDKDELTRRVRLHASLQAYEILAHLKKQFGANLRVMQTGKEVEFND